MLFICIICFVDAHEGTRVPKPWTNLKQESVGDRVFISCWGRKYEFNTRSLLQQININNNPILKQPVQIFIDGKSPQILKSCIRTIKSTVEQIDLIQDVVFDLNRSPYTMQVKASIYYDGIIYFEIEVLNNKPIRNEIAIRYEMSSGTSKLYNRFANITSSQREGWKTGVYQADRTSYIPYFWIGNTDMGLFWFCESPATWTNYSSDNAVNFSIRNGAAQVVLNLVSKNSLNTSQWKFEFGLQATPVKPLAGIGRKWMLSGAESSNVNVVWPDAGKPYQLKYFGYPEPLKPKAFEKHLKEIGKNGRKTLVYNSLTYISSDAPEWKNNNSWNTGAKDLSADVKAYKAGDFVQADYTDESFKNFIIDKSMKFIHDYGFDGFYLDYAMLGNLNSVKNIKAFNTNNKIPYYPFMESRKLYEAFYKRMKSNTADKIVIMHSSARIIPPILAFSDIFVNGEQFRQDRSRVASDYLKVTNLAAFQTEYSGKPYGLKGMFLPAFNAQNYSSIYPTRRLASILLQHDISAWPIYSVTVVWNEIFKILNGFSNLETATFYAYTDQMVFKHNYRDILISYYRNDKNQVLGIISNIGNEPTKATIAIDQDRLNKNSLNITKLTNRGAIENYKANQIKLTVPAGDYMIFKID